MRYRAILFDLDDTLIPEDPAIEAGFAAVAERVWGTASAERVAGLWAAADQVLHDQAPAPEYLTAVHITASDLLHGSVVADGPDADALRAFVPHYIAHAFDPILPARDRPRTRELVEVWRASRLSALSVYPETVSVLERLAGRVSLGLVTNGLATLQRDKLRLTGLSGYFESVLVAEDVGAAKPAATMFQVTLDRLGLCPDQAVMVGNDLQRDIGGGRSAGLATVHVARDASTRTASSITSLTELEPRLAGRDL